MRRYCLLCEKRPARRLQAPVMTHRRSYYVNAAKEAVFCSVRCAANWALLHVLEDSGQVWCPKHGWAYIAADPAECSDCFEERAAEKRTAEVDDD